MRPWPLSLSVSFGDWARSVIFWLEFQEDLQDIHVGGNFGPQGVTFVSNNFLKNHKFLDTLPTSNQCMSTAP